MMQSCSSSSCCSQNIHLPCHFPYLSLVLDAFPVDRGPIICGDQG
jgi:hypothetical protein